MKKRRVRVKIDIGGPEFGEMWLESPGLSLGRTPPRKQAPKKRRGEAARFAAAVFSQQALSDAQERRRVHDMVGKDVTLALPPHLAQAARVSPGDAVKLVSASGHTATVRVAGGNQTLNVDSKYIREKQT